MFPARCAARTKSPRQPDYVLIDSRAGHTDTCGICTRQLPDSVVVFFFPNEQNLRGLAEVVGDIRAEAQAIDAGYEQPEAYLKRARIRVDNEDTSGATEDAWRVLASSPVAPPMVREALGRLLHSESATPYQCVALS